jgi:hypothetical protein
MKYFILFIFFTVISSETNAQYNGRSFSLSINGVYTTSARIYKEPFASDPVVRMDFFPVEDIFSPSVELRYALSNSLFIGVGTEYMKVTESGSAINVFTEGAVRTIFVEDGFTFFPLELTGYYLLPFSTERFRFLMGGGGGYYFGSHIRKFGNAEVSVMERKFAYGIHVVLTMDYLLRQNISIRTEMKFRDPQFIIKSTYNAREIDYNGRTIRILQESFDSKINIDGVTFILGAAYHF